MKKYRNQKILSPDIQKIVPAEIAKSGTKNKKSLTLTPVNQHIYIGHSLEYN